MIFPLFIFFSPCIVTYPKMKILDYFLLWKNKKQFSNLLFLFSISFFFPNFFNNLLPSPLSTQVPPPHPYYRCSLSFLSSFQLQILFHLSPFSHIELSLTLFSALDSLRIDYSALWVTCEISRSSTSRTFEPAICGNI